MADCLKSVVQEIGNCILIQYARPFFEPHVDYWWCFESNIEGLKNGSEELGRRKDCIEQERDEARRRTASLRPSVEPWLQASTEKLEEARILLRDDNIPAWNLISRYLLGKKAKKTADEIGKLLGNQINFDTIADPVLTLEFESRKSIEKRIIDSLEKNSVDMIGICGMGGIGRTTMSQRIGKKLMEKKLFDEVVTVTVSQTVDLPKIQNDIAKSLGLESFPVRSDQLLRKLMDSAKRKLIIFDDVWERLKFEELEIPIENNFGGRFKVLFTSRSRDTWNTIIHHGRG